MGKWLERFAESYSFWILIAVAVYFGYAVYYAFYGLNFSLAVYSNSYVHSNIARNPWWWAILYYGSEGVMGTVASMLRAIGGAFAFYAAFLFWKKRDVNSHEIRGKIRAALIFEGAFFLCLIVTMIAAFAYNSTNQYLYYFDHTPGLLLLFGTAIPCLAMIVIVAPLLFKLSQKISSGSSREEMIKWSCITGITYIFVVFWFNFLMLWQGTMVPYSSEVQSGIGFLLQPANFASFVLSVFGLFAIGLFALFATLPAIKKQPKKLNFSWIGVVLTALSSFYLYLIFDYYLTGGYGAHPSVWYEVIGPPHNSNLWPASFLVLGLSIIAYGRKKKLDEKQKLP